MLFEGSAPGSVMLFGEHAILHGYSAIVTAIQKKITVTLSPRQDDNIIIYSALGKYKTTLSDITIEKPFTFILATLKDMPLTCGCELNITSDFTDQLGLGSSAAVTVASLKAIAKWLNMEWSESTLLNNAIKIIQKVQGVGSGADCAASVYDTILLFNANPRIVTPLKRSPPFSLAYCGYKTPTVEVIQKVASRFKSNPNLYQMLIKKIGDCSLAAKHYIEQGDFQTLGDIAYIQQQLLDELGVSDAHIKALIKKLEALSGIHGAKISGAGLGDCVIAFGEPVKRNDFIYTSPEQ